MRVFFGTLIGYHMKILFSSNKNYDGIEGIVLDETRNTFIIRSIDNKILRILKKDSTFQFSLDKEKYVFDGDVLIGDVVKRVIKL